MAWRLLAVAHCIRWCRLALTPILQDESPYLFFVPAVLVAAGIGGLGPGLMATGLGALLGFLCRHACSQHHRAAKSSMLSPSH